MALPESFLKELTDRSDIVDVVSGYVKLTKRSGANLFGLCPFHSEKTPSFSVSPDKQIYHCFGCGKGGGVISFIMEMENLSFRDAVEFLARRAGLAVPEDAHDESRHDRERMLMLNRDAARFFHDCLKAPEGQIARDYVNRRGISPKMVTSFGLGFAPNCWDSLRRAMAEKGYSVSEMLSAGLLRASKKSGGGAYDTFRNRLMFPVIDVRGQVIGFSGRILDDGEPKYMNSPETPVFNKSRNLFALNLAKKSKSAYIILAEGNVDVVSLHQAGFDGAVASLGTSLTAEQARLISRYTKNVVIAYDADDAGKKAAQRAIGILDKLDLNVKVLQLTGAKDPDEFIQKRGAEAFRALIEGSGNHIEYLLATAAAKYNLSSDDDKVRYLKEATRLIAALGSAVERDVYSARVAEQVGVSKDAVRQEAERSRKSRARSEDRQRERELARPGASVQPAVKSIRYENTRSAAAEQGVIRLIYLEPELCSAARELKKEDFSSEFLGRTFEEFMRARESGGDISLDAMAEDFTPDEISCITAILQKPERLSSGDKAMHDYIEIIRSEKMMQGGADLRAIAEAQRKTKGYGGKNE